MAIVAPDHVDLGRDAALVERTQAGEIEAFEDLYRRYFPRLRRFCMRYLHDPADAEEVAQEALARAYRSIASLGGDRRFYPWLSVIAKRLCIDHSRRQARLELAPDIETCAFEAGPDERLVELANHQMIRSALGTLSPRHREVLELREVDGWSYQRIADTYGVSLGTVEQLLHRARKSLRKSFLELDGQSIGAASGFPLLGWVSRRWTHFRIAVHSRASRIEEVLTPLSARAAGLAIVAGAAGIGGGMPAHVATVAAAPRARVVSVVAASVAAAAPEAATSAGHATTTGGKSIKPPTASHPNAPLIGPGESRGSVKADPHFEFRAAGQPGWVRLPTEVYLLQPFIDIAHVLKHGLTPAP